MRLPLLLALAFTTSCAEGVLDGADSLVFDGATDKPLWAVVDGPAADAPDGNTTDVPVVDVPVVDAGVDVPAVAVDVRPVDAAQPADVAAVVDVGVDVPVAADVPAATDAGFDVPVDSGWGDGPTGYRVARDDPGATWVDACAQPGHLSVLTDLDDGSYPTALPFRFRYWGRALAEGAPVIVSSNGYITFQPGAPTPANGIIPNHLDGVDAVVAAQWRDLRTRSNGVCLATVGNLGARRWVIGWSDVHYYTSALGHLNFAVVLNEGSNAIDFVYGSMTLSEPATVALEDWDGSRSSVPFTIPQPIVFSNTRTRFVPQ